MRYRSRRHAAAGRPASTPDRGRRSAAAGLGRRGPLLEGLDQQIHPLLGMDATEKEPQALAAHMGEAPIESLALALGIGRLVGSAVAHH
jgi:hypothetical protein